MASEPCMYYLRGNCRFGRKCWNSHDLDAYLPSGNAQPAADGIEAFHSQDYAGAISTNHQPHSLRHLIEASKTPKINQPTEIDKAMEKMAIELSLSVKEGNNTNVKVNAKELPELHQKENKESPETCDDAFNDVVRCAIDNDLQCNICFEIFIKPTVLNCSHTFCETCIHVWSKRAKKCPICRVHIRSKSLCLTLNSFIEKVVEHLPLEIKQKRGAAVKDRNQIKIANPNRRVDIINRFNSLDLAALLNLDELGEIEQPLHYISMDQNDDINADIIVEESEMFRMNLHDTVVSTRGVNPLMSYTQQGPIRRANNSFARH